MNERTLPTGAVRRPDGSYDTAGKSRTRIRDRNPGATAIVERDSRNGAMGAVQVQRPDTGRFLVRLTAVRHRLLDEDNACEKYHVDCCRYAGLLPNDSPRTTQIETRQEKAEPGGREFVRVQIYRKAAVLR